jgi:hypothetical protein
MKTLQHILLSVGFILTAHAGQSVFSADGKTIYLLPMSEGAGVHKIVPAAKTHQTIQPVKNIGEDAITALTRNPQGEIVLCTKRALWIWDGKEASAKKWMDLPQKFECLDLSCTLVKTTVPAGTIFLHGTKQDENRFTLLTLLPGKQQWLEVFCRRNEAYSAPQTNAAGRMFFASNFDLWEGTMIPEEADEIAGSIEGCRIAPLAMMNADSGNSGGMVVGNVVVAGTQVFSQLEGRHMGAILQTPAPAKALYPNPESNEHPDLSAQYKLMQNSLAQTKIHYEGGPCDALSVHETSPTACQIFWRQDLEGDRAWMLLASGGKPQQIGTEAAE